MNPQLTRFWLVTTAAGALTACAATPQYAVRMDGSTPGSTTPAPGAGAPVATVPLLPPPPPAPPAQVAQTTPPPPAITAMPTAPVTSQPLAPPPSAARPVAPPPGPSAPPPQPTTVTRTVIVAAGQVVTVAGTPATYKVKSGDTLIGIADKLNMYMDDLAKANNLKAPYRLRPGQTLKGKATTAKAYVVQSGDTLFSVAQRFNVTTASLATQNKIRTTSTIRAGQRLTLPSNYRDSGPITRTETVTVPAGGAAAAAPALAAATAAPPARTTTTTTTTSTIAPPPSPLLNGRGPVLGSTTTTTTTTTTPPTTLAQGPLRGSTPPRPPSTVLESTGPASDAQVRTASAGMFEWPLRGDVITPFTPRNAPVAGGQRSDGLTITTAAATPVRAAAAGRVRYAGNDLPGLGNTVLIEHGANWVTAYSHLGRMDVRINQEVTQGQQIGATAAANQAPFEFQVRYAPGARDSLDPVDPMLVLPR